MPSVVALKSVSSTRQHRPGSPGRRWRQPPSSTTHSALLNMHPRTRGAAHSCTVVVRRTIEGREGVRVISTIEVADQGSALAYTFEDLMRYHGPGSPGGVAHAVKVMERVLPLLEPGGLPERREIEVETAFAGPGARDAFEMVIRAVTEGRYVIDDALARPELGPTRERFVFRLGYRGRSVTVVLREGYVGEEFIALARMEERTEQQESRLTVLKREMAELLLATPATEVYDVDGEV
jgi:hypothetical protein